MNTFLLNTFQLNVRGENERNLHIFYELLEASDSAHKDLLFLDDVCALDFQMLCGTNDQRELLGDDDQCELLGDAESFNNLVNAMRVVGFNDEEVAGCFAIVASLLHASNLSFVSLSDTECKIDVKNRSCKAFQFLLHVDKKEILDELYFRQK